MNEKFTEEEMELLDNGTHPLWELTSHFLYPSGMKMKAIATCRITGKVVGEILSTGSRQNARKIRRLLKGREENPGLSTEEVAEKLGIDLPPN